MSEEEMMQDVAWGERAQAGLQEVVARGQLSGVGNFVHPLTAEQEAAAEARQKAEEARWKAERDEERAERNRGTALQLAAAVAGQQGDPNAVLSAARDFLGFLAGQDRQTH